MSSSVSHLTSLRMFKTLVLLIGTFGPQLFAQQAPAAPSPSKATHAPTDSSQVSSGKTQPALTVSGNVSSNVTPAKADAAAQNKAQLQYLHLPLAFEKNQGQADAHVKFLSRGAGYGLFLTDREAVLSFGGQKASSIKLQFLGADSKSTVDATDRLPGTSNYFLGNDRAKWHTNVPNFAKVEYKNLYSGIDLVYYGNQQKIEHDFVVAPHADPAQIRFAIDGAKKLALEKSGDLVVTTSSGELRLRKPAIYQTVNGARKEIAGGYALKHGNQVSFMLGAYDRERELTIDPVLILSTYLADVAGVSATGVAVDGSGIYVTGNTRAANFNSVTPTLNSRGNQSVPNDDIYVVKLDPAGNHLIYSAIIGGAGTDTATSIAVDGGNAYVGGVTQSADFPTSSGAYKTTSVSQDGFFLKLNSAGDTLSYSSYFGGDTGTNDAVNGIAVYGGQIYLTGKTDSSTGISTTNSFQPSLGSGATLNAFVAAVNPAGNGSADLAYGTYLGGTASDSGNAIAVSGANGVFVTGNATSSNFPVSNGSALGTQTQDAFVARIDTTSSANVSGVCLNGTTHTDELTTTSPHNFIVGETVLVSGFGAGAAGTNFNGQFTITAVPTSTSLQYIDSSCTSDADASTANGNVTGGRVYATYFGGGAVGTTSTSGNAIALDASGNPYITGQTSATAGISTGGVFQTALDGTSDAYVAKFDGTGSATYGTYLGGTADEQGNAIAVDAGGNAYVAGFTTSPAGLATANALFGTFAGTQDAFVAKVNSTATTLIYSTYLGGTGSNDSANTIAVNPSGVNSSNVPVAVVAGNTTSSAFPTTGSAFQPSATGSNAFVASLDAADSGVVLSFDPLTGVSPAGVRADSHTQDQITYQYVVANASGANSALNTVFNDLKPSGVTLGTANFKSGSTQLTCPLSAPSDCSIGSGGVTCHLGTLSDTTTNTSQFATVCITATPTSTIPGTTITNSNASVAAANADSVPASPLTTTVVNSTQVTVTAAQTSPTGNATVADTNTFRDRLTLHNDGPNDIQAGQAQFVISVNSASNASLSGIAVTPNDPADDCGSGPGNPATTLPATCILGAVTNGTSHTFDVSATINLTSGHTGSVTIQGTVSSTNSAQFQLDSTSTLSATQTTNAATEADLSTAVTGTNPVDSGFPVDFTVNVNSAGSFTAGGSTMTANTVAATLIVIITPTTANYTTVTITPQNGDNCGDGINAPHSVTVSGVTPVTCNLSIAAGSTHQFALSGTGAIAGVATAGSIKVDATVAPAAGPSYTDVNTGNDAAGTFTTNLTSAADLRTVVAPATQTVNNGTANTTLTVTVSNVAGSSIPNTQLSGTLVLTNSSFGTVTLQPGNAGDDCGAGPGVLVTLAGNTFACALSRLDVGTPHTFTVNGTPTITGTNVSGSVRLDAALTALSTYTELNPGDENSSGIVNITPVADLASTTTGTASLNSGTLASFNIQVSDAGPNSVAGTTVSGKITITNANFNPTLTPQVGDTCSIVTYGGGNPNIGTFTCTLGQINAGSPHTISVSGTATITGTFTTGSVKVEVLTLAGSYFDPKTLGRGVNNDPSTFTTTLIPVADLTSSTSGAASVNSGSPASFTLQISDGGPNSVAGTTLSGKIAINNASFTPTLTPQVGDSCSAVTFGGGNPNVGTFTCTLGKIDTSSPHTLTVSGTPTITGIFTSGSVRVDVLTLSGSYFDPNTGNDASNFTTNLVPVAHLSTVLTRNTAGILQEGDPISYTLTVSNSGPNYLASGAAKVTGTFAGSGTAAAPNSVISGLALSGCASSTVNIPNPGDYVCILPATNVAAPAVTISITGTAHVTSGIIDALNGASTAAPNNSGYSESSPGATSATAPSTNIQPKTHLSTSIMRTTPAVVKEGDTVSYTIHVASSNMNLAAGAAGIGGTFAGSGLATAPNSTITGMTLANCSSPIVDTPNPGNFSCVLPAISVASGADIIVSGTAHVLTGIQDTLSGITTAAPTGNNYFETQPLATSSNAPTTVIRPATDLQPSVAAPSTLQNGLPATYTVQVTNNGSTPANNLASGAAKVAISFTGTNSSFAITTATGCTPTSSSSVSCVLGALNANQNQQFTITGTPTLNSGTSDTLTLTATVSPNNGNDYFDTNTTNDTKTVNASIKGVSKLTLAFTGSATSVLVGNNLAYNISVSNDPGVSAAAGVNVTVPLGTGQTFVLASSSSNCSILPADVTANIVTCQMGNSGVVPAGTSSTATVVVMASPLLVPKSALGNPRQSTYLQSATVNVDAAQTVNNNAATSTQSVNSKFEAAAHITVAHTNSTAPALIDTTTGSTYNNVVYTTVVTNVAGRSDAQNVVITDTPPSGPNVNFVSASVAGGTCSGSGPVTCNIPLLASGNTATVTITVRPVRSATMPPIPITDKTDYVSSDVTDPTSAAGGLTDSSTIEVHNSVPKGTLPLNASASGRMVQLKFGGVMTTGVTQFDTTANFSGLTLPPLYPLSVQPATPLLYVFSTTAVISEPVQFCFDTSGSFLKPERVRMFRLSSGTPVDITSSIIFSSTQPARLATVCGTTTFSSGGSIMLGIFEPKNNPPTLQFAFTPSSAGKGVTGSFVNLNVSGSSDPDSNNPCNGNASLCSDTLTFYFFFVPFRGSISTTAALPVVTSTLPTGTTAITVVAVDQTVPVPAVVDTPDQLTGIPSQTGLAMTTLPVSNDLTGGGTTNVTTATILAGQSTSFNFKAAPTAAQFPAPTVPVVVTFSCANGSATPSLDSLGIKCSVNPPSFTINPPDPNQIQTSIPNQIQNQNAALLISTTGATLGKAQPAPGAPLYAAWIAFAGMPFAGIVIISVFGPGRRRRWLKLLLAFGLLVVAIGSQVACGGGSMKPPSPSFATPRGNYEIVVTGTQNGTALSKNSFTITVQ